MSPDRGGEYQRLRLTTSLVIEDARTNPMSTPRSYAAPLLSGLVVQIRGGRPTHTQKLAILGGEIALPD